MREGRERMSERDVCVCFCVCQRERERERERVNEREKKRGRERGDVNIYKKERRWEGEERRETERD